MARKVLGGLRDPVGPVFGARNPRRPRRAAIVVGLLGLALSLYAATLLSGAWAGPDGPGVHLPSVERYDLIQTPSRPGSIIGPESPSRLPLMAALGLVVGIVIWIGSGEITRRRSSSRVANSYAGSGRRTRRIERLDRRRVGRWWPMLTALMLAVLVLGLVANQYTAGTLAQDHHVDDGFPALRVGTGPVLDLGAEGVRSAHTPARHVALTFDDGPDPRWTPAILDVLAEQRVPGTFFVIGEHVTEYPEIVRRVLGQGGELGVHTYRHVEISGQPPAELRRDLRLTQLAIVGATGHETGLFRPPFITDRSNVGLQQYVALKTVSAQGYLTVLADKDSTDWSRPGVNEIVLRSIPTGGAGAIIELHDGGGDRSQTVAALSTLIRLLKLQGYQFDTMSGLARLDAHRLMPAVGFFERTWGLAFLATMNFAGTLSWWFLALAFGVALLTMIRLLLLVGVVWWRSRWTRKVLGPVPPQLPPMSVIVAAYNEAGSIRATLEALSSARSGQLQIIVVDDGSTDDTAGVVAAYPDPRVELLSVDHRGKAGALAAGLDRCTADVIVTVDADTRPTRNALVAIAAPFADTRVGGVSGNVRVARPRGLLGAAQHLEYVVGNGLDRAALDALHTQVTIPGAAGAFRRTALLAVGGFDGATIAEDTDLTLALVGAGWRVRFASEAIVETSAPTTVRGLWRQRSRWSFGIAQAVWRRREMVRAVRNHPAGVATWLFVVLSQILLPIAAPFIDLAAVWALLTGTRFPLALWLMVGLMQLGAAAVALRMEGQSWRGLLALPLHLFGYRQVTSFVVIQTVAWAVAGRRPGWGAQPVTVLSEYGDPNRADVDAPVVAPGVGPSDAARGRDPVRRAA